MLNGNVSNDLKKYCLVDSKREYMKITSFKASSLEISIKDAIRVKIKDNIESKVQDIIITNVHYIGFFPNALEEYIQEQHKDIAQYEVSFSAIPNSVQYVPSIKTHIPKIYSIQTAIVSKGQSDSKKSANEIDIDNKGRIRVLLHFDENNATSCYLRLSNFYAGDGYGSRFIPRVNSEVIVSFINGDINKPIITGALHNKENKIPYYLPDSKTKSFIRTHSIPAHTDQVGYNEVAFEDKNSHELLSLRAQKDYSLLALNNSDSVIQNSKTLNVSNNNTTSIGNDNTTSIGNDDTKEVSSNCSLSIGGNHTTNVAMNQANSVLMNNAETIGIAKALSIGAGYQISVGGAKNESVGLSSTEQVGKLKHIVVGDRFELSVGESSLVLNEDGTIILSGKSVAIQGSDGITISSKSVEIN